MVSIITPSYNSANYISETIRSVLAQTFCDWEMIIVDDCSSDDSVEIIELFVSHDPRIKLIRLFENVGAAKARNLAIEAATGRYIAFLDSDDIWLPHKLESQLAFMCECNRPFTYAAYDKIDQHGRVFGHVNAPGRVSYDDLLRTCIVGCLTSVYDVRFFGKVYMPTNTKREDFATWLRLLKSTDYAYGLNQTLAQYRVYNGQSSAKKVLMAAETWRLYREVEGFNLLKAGYFFSHYAVRGALRTKAPALAAKLGIL